jgi:phosphoglycolate phosphatase
MTYLVLFDIDGTLLDSDGAGRQAMTAALPRVFGTSGAIDAYSMAGKIDTQIVAELMSSAGLSDDAIQRHMAEYFTAYVDELERRVTEHDIHPLPGAVELLERLRAQPNVAIGVLTGNIARAATIKLRRAGLADYFHGIGAFGDDARSRPDLPAIAVQRARGALGHHYVGRNIVIIGDTPADIECGRALGVKSIAVATGPHSCTDLRQHQPDFCFPDLVDTDAIMQAILHADPPENSA